MVLMKGCIMSYIKNISSQLQGEYDILQSPLNEERFGGYFNQNVSLASFDDNTVMINQAIESVCEKKRRELKNSRKASPSNKARKKKNKKKK
jgi:hypothetical protein